MGEQITQGLIVCDVKKQKKHHRHRVIHNQKNNTLGRVHMKKFTKLALAASVALSANAMAMQAMDDSTLSATTGQDGLTIGIGISQVTIEKLFIHDNDGLDGKLGTDGAPSTSAGAIVIRGKTDTAPTAQDKNATTATHAVVIKANYDNDNKYLLASRNLADLVIDSDAGNGNPFINIAAEVSGLDINIGRIGVTASDAVPAIDATNIQRGGTGKVNDILSGLDIKTGKMTANIQLGAAPQGAMIKLNTTMFGGLEILNLGILDNSTTGKPVGLDGATPIVTTAAGEIFIESIKIADSGSKDLVINQTVSVYGASTLPETTGKSKGFVEIVGTSGAHDMYVKGIHLGSQTAASIGDVEIQGLQTFHGSPKFGGDYTPGSKITISGH